MQDLQNARKAMELLSSYNIIENLQKKNDEKFNYTPSKILIFLILLLSKKYKDEVKRLAVYIKIAEHSLPDEGGDKTFRLDLAIHIYLSIQETVLPKLTQEMN